MMKKYFKISIATIVLFVSMTGVAVAASEKCPAADMIHYDTKTEGRFVANVDHVLWQSPTMAAIDPMPTIEYLNTVAIGTKKEAQVMCAYRVGLNSFQMVPDHKANLGADWQEVRNNFYFCPRTKKCDFLMEK